MLHPLLHLIATEPHLLAEHAQGYAALAGAELDTLSAGWKRRALLGSAALVGAVAAIVFAGTAVMLWAVVPSAQIHAPWALVAVPLVPAVGALACLWAARSPSGGTSFGKLREQVAADIAMLREVGQP